MVALEKAYCSPVRQERHAKAKETVDARWQVGLVLRWKESSWCFSPFGRSLFVLRFRPERRSKDRAWHCSGAPEIPSQEAACAHPQTLGLPLRGREPVHSQFSLRSFS